MNAPHLGRTGPLLVGAGLLVAASLVAAAGISGAATPALPIPSDPRDNLLEPFTGEPAVATPLPDVHVPRHPFMAPNDASNIHNDAYQTDAYAGAGPLGHDLTVTSTLFVAECASVTFDSRGRIVTVCVSPIGASLRIIHPTTLATIATYDLPPRKLGSFSFTDFSGGGYFYLDHRDRAVVSTFTGHILTIKVEEEALTLVRDVDVSAVADGSGIISALPDWAGRIWFVTESGVVGFVKANGAVASLTLRAGEQIANSFAMDESGGVFIVSTAALYRFDARLGRPSVTWRKAYDSGIRVKPGQVSQGSGTTPTLVGTADSPGGGWVAITDNAETRMHVLVFTRGKRGPGQQPLCKQAVFPPNQGATDNSLISVPGGLIAENNYGYTGPLPSGVNTRTADTVPGLVRIDVDYRNGGCHVAWSNDEARIPSVVSKASLANGLVYSYTHPSAAELPWSGLSLPALLAPDSWFFAAYDVRTGREVWSKLTGTGLGYNNHYAPVSIGPDGAAYVGTLGGLIRIADS